MITQFTYRTKVRDYVSSVMSGELVVGKLVRAAVERHLRDLERVGSDEWLYEFDDRAAERACLFFKLGIRHSQGEWAGEPFELSDWQAFCVWMIFGWKRKSDGARRFRKAYISVGRKNGKSTFCAGMGLFLLVGDGEQGAQVYIGATKLDQAKIIYDEADRMTRSSPDLRKILKPFRNNLTYPATNSFLRPVGSDKPYDGLGPHAVFFDELHAWRELHRDFYETMTTGSAARRQPLQVTITTAGSDKSLIWQEEDRMVRNVVTGVVEDDTLFGFVCTIDDEDDPFDESCWIKANPNLGVSVKLDYLRQQAKEAQNKPTSRNAFIRYHANRQVSSVEDAITQELWDAAEGELSDWKEADYIGAGFDIGGRDDLAGAARVARFRVESESDNPVWRYEIKARGYIASQTKRDLDKQPWQQWIYNGYLKHTDRVIVDLRDELLEDAAAEGVRSVAFDPYNARQLGEELDSEGLEVAKMPQNHGQFNEPIREFLTALRDGRIRHDGHPVLKWCALNLAIDQSSRGDWMCDKKHSKEKIDLIVAVLMAFREAMFAEVVGDCWTFADGASW